MTTASGRVPRDAPCINLRWKFHSRSKSSKFSALPENFRTCEARRASARMGSATLPPYRLTHHAHPCELGIGSIFGVGGYRGEGGDTKSTDRNLSTRTHWHSVLADNATPSPLPCPTGGRGRGRGRSGLFLLTIGGNRGFFHMHRRKWDHHRGGSHLFQASGSIAGGQLELT